MASYIAILQDDLANGFSKRELEVLIGLPKNSLASILTGKRNLSPKSQLKIKRWEASEKPNPLDIVLKKVEENNKPENKERILKERNTVIEKSNTVHLLSPDDCIHKLYKNGDPKENSAAFMMKYDCANYAELEKKLTKKSVKE